MISPLRGAIEYSQNIQHEQNIPETNISLKHLTLLRMELGKFSKRESIPRPVIRNM